MLSTCAVRQVLARQAAIWSSILMILLLGCAGIRKNDSAVLMRSQQVQATLVEIAVALDQYRAEHEYYPEGLATLRDANYFSLMPDLEQEWAFNFGVDGGKVMMVEAVSQATMPDGPGYKITYRVLANKWEGYGITIWPVP
jgi:hypothetical protein